MTSARRLPLAFENAVMTFVAAKTDAVDDLATALMALPDDDWQRSRAALVNWIDRGCREAPAYRRVVEMVDYQREGTR
jgi:hypothetical protein